MRPALQLLALVAGRAGLVAASIVSVHTSTRLLGPHEMGTLNLVLVAIGAVALPVAGCSHYFYRQAMSWQQDGTLHANLRRYALFLTLAAVLAAALAWCLPSAWLPAPAGWLALLLAGNLGVASLQHALLHLVNLAGRRLAYAGLGNLVAWGGLGLAIWASQHHGALAVHWLAGLLAAQFVVLVLMLLVRQAPLVLLVRQAPLVLLVRQAPLVLQVLQVMRVPDTAPVPRPATAAVAQPAAAYTPRPVFAFAWPLVLCLALYWVQRSLPLPWLAAQQGTETVGLFAVGCSVGMLAMLSFDTLFKELYGPRYEREIAHAPHATRVAAWERYAAAFVPALIAACICTAAAGPALLAALTAPAFHGLAVFVAWGALCQLLLSVHGLVMLQATSTMDNRVLLLPNAAGALLTALLLAGPARTDPSTQAALATAAGLLAATALAGWRLQRVHAARWPWRRSAWAAAAGAPVLGATQLAHPALALAGVALFGLALQWQLSRGWWKAQPA